MASVSNRSGGRRASKKTKTTKRSQGTPQAAAARSVRLKAPAGIKPVRAAPGAAAAPELRDSIRAQRELAIRAERDRRQRIAAFRKTLRTERRGGAAAGRRLRLLAEGDSWFHYPVPLSGGSVIDHLDALTPHRILNLAHAGDEVRQMMSLEQRLRLESLLGDDELAFDALLFSGGGNDLVGDEFCLWLNDRAVVDGRWLDAIRPDRFSHVMALLASGYEELLDLRDRLRPGCVVFGHTYDFPRPDGRGVCGLGPWLRPSLRYRGWTDADEGFAIVRDMLLQLDTLLAGLERTRRDFVYVRTQGTLDPDTDWANEIHPNRAGFRKIAAKFEAALSARFP